MTPTLRVRLYGLDSLLASELKSALSRLPVELSNEDPDVVFCAVERPVFEEARRRFPRCPIVVVSRLPEVSAWLDALDGGAADYCGAPFEPAHLSWMFRNLIAMPPRAAAA